MDIPDFQTDPPNFCIFETTKPGDVATGPAGPAMATASRVVTRIPTARVRKRACVTRHCHLDASIGMDMCGGNDGKKIVKDGCTITS